MKLFRWFWRFLQEAQCPIGGYNWHHGELQSLTLSLGPGRTPLFPKAEVRLV